MLILVAGLINIETTLKIDGFPIDYSPVRFPFFGVNSTVSGVGYNIARALTTLGNQVRLTTLIGRDPAGVLVRQALAADGIAGEYVLAELEHTAQSVILYDPTGRRQINSDLKDIQARHYPRELFDHAVAGCELAVLANINFARPLLAVARQHGITIASDVHTISQLDDPYNRDFMAAADILFMSHELLPCAPGEWARQVQAEFDPAIIVIGMGSAGALLAVRGAAQSFHVPAVTPRPLVSTIGAGDALFSAFVHSYARSRDPHLALRQAVVFAGYKIGEAGAAQGFLNEAQLALLAG